MATGPDSHGESDLAEIMADVATQLRQEPDEEHTVTAVVTRAVEIVPGASDASITMRTRKEHLTLASSSERSRRADALQYDLDEGPCIRVADGYEWVRSGAVGADERWPQWGPRAAALGVGSLLSIPLLVGTTTLGALNIYADEEGAFPTRDEADLALIFAVHAAHAMSVATQVKNLGIALSSRHEIGVAQGIVMERFGLSQPQSFDLLRRLSSHANLKLTDIAHSIVVSGRVSTHENTAPGS